MKIGSPDNKPTLNPLGLERKTDGSGGQGSGSSGGVGNITASATVEISATASQLRSASSATSSADGSFDAEKVKRIAQAIRDGKFEVNAHKIADKLISNAQELLSRSSA